MFGRQKLSMELDFEDMSEDVKKMTVQQIKNALKMCGAQAVSFATMYCVAKKVVDTSLLKNSLTFAPAGKTTKIRDYKGDQPSQYKSGTYIPSGRYEGTAPEDQKGEHSVYIGTNVLYAIYQEFGWTHYKSGKKYAARPYLRPALEDHVEDYKTIFKEYLEKLDGDGKLGN